jgi:hypothetical protein
MSSVEEPAFLSQTRYVYITVIIPGNNPQVTCHRDYLDFSLRVIIHAEKIVSGLKRLYTVQQADLTHYRQLL